MQTATVLPEIDSMRALMTQDDIAEVTGAKQPAKQIAILCRNGIPHLVDANGRPKLTWYQYNNAHMMRKPINDGPDFSALDRK
ncbi:DUF4224 domain-containing protein [Shewanella algae]